MKLLVGKLIFVKYFGYPSLLNYQAQEKLISESHVPFRIKTLPAITIAASLKPGNGVRCGRKNISCQILHDSKYIQSFCNHSDNLNSTLKCITSNMFELSEVVEDQFYELKECFTPIMEMYFLCQVPMNLGQILPNILRSSYTNI